MKIDSMFRVLIFFVVLMTFSMSFPTFAQMTGVQRQASQDAKRHAEASTNTCLWFATGFIGHFIGYLIAYTYHSPVPTEPLLGKSPAYVVAYTDAYRKASQKRQSRLVLYGCVSATTIGLVVTAAYNEHQLTGWFRRTLRDLF